MTATPLFAALLGAIVLTSTLSGIVGMAGGMILMAIMVTVLSVPAAMVLHGATQLTANGSRCFLLREHIVWSILPPYLLGAAAATLLFVLLRFIPDPAVVLILVGLFPWLGRLVPKLQGLNVERPVTAVACGLVVTIAQLVAGASGPLLDVFYLNTRFDRHQIIATKALTQTLGHLIKLGYYGSILGVSTTEIPLWVFPAAIIAAVAGTRLGTSVLDRIDEVAFRRYSTWAILTIATWCVASGLYALITG